MGSRGVNEEGTMDEERDGKGVEEMAIKEGNFNKNRVSSRIIEDKKSKTANGRRYRCECQID
ncbi:conserved hypothetical protein [Ricinus communis]|uniref:Uncharacterized protein n=1 Tax=Ricinus communis TaxID=3988 RepID=B9SCD3_RICCO|nr:conserved hypothetical protein [Ricinus communis]